MKTTTLSALSAALVTLATAAVVLATPAGALAAHHHTPARHRARHAARSHHAARTQVIHVGSGKVGSTDGTAEPGTAVPAATVVSFRDGILKVKLIGGSVLSGRVKAATRVSCAPAPSVEVEPVAEEEPEGEPGAEGGGEEETQEEETQVEPTETCQKSDLTPGAAIADALLAVGRHSSTWTRVELSY